MTGFERSELPERMGLHLFMFIIGPGRKEVNLTMAITFSMTPEGNIINDHHLIAQVLREALPYINFLKGKTIVIKLGGSTLEHQRAVLQDVIWLHTLGAYPVRVHGGGGGSDGRTSHWDQWNR